MIHNMNWIALGACKGQTELFFPPNSSYAESSRQRRVRERSAISICQSCPVLLECRNHARTVGEHGVWGGETDDDRWNAGYMRNNRELARKRRDRVRRSAAAKEQKAALSSTEA